MFIQKIVLVSLMVLSGSAIFAQTDVSRNHDIKSDKEKIQSDQKKINADQSKLSTDRKARNQDQSQVNVDRRR